MKIYANNHFDKKKKPIKGYTYYYKRIMTQKYIKPMTFIGIINGNRGMISYIMYRFQYESGSIWDMHKRTYQKAWKEGRIKFKSF